MPWIQISFNCNKDLSTIISDALSTLGAASVTLQDAADQALLEPGVGETPLWEQVVVTGLFDAAVDIDSVADQIRNAIAPEKLPPWRASSVEDKAWEREWMKHFHPMRFGHRTWICPSWQSPPQPDAVNILLDPGLAFGTGTHPTTALCLEWLDQHVQGGETVIDFGCGSGILGIGALMLGASEVWAVDNDPQALLATRDNAIKNQVETNLHLRAADESFNIQSDIILANILANPLVSLAPFFAAKIKTGGKAILSGILSEQQDLIMKAYCTNFKLLSSAQNGDWIRLDLMRN